MSRVGQYIIIFILLLIAVPSYSQVNADSLVKLIPTANSEQKVKIYSELEKIYFGNDINKAEYYARKAIYEAKALDKKKELADMYHELGKIIRIKNFDDSSLVYFRKSIEIKQFTKDYEGLHKTWGNIGDMYLYRGEWEKGLMAADSVMNYAKKADNKRSTGISNMLKGNIYLQMAKYDKANVHLQQALKIFEEIDDKPGIARALNNIALIYQNLDKLEEALKFFKSSLEISEFLRDVRSEAEALNNIGNIYSNKVIKNYDANHSDRKAIDSAILYNTKAKEKFKKIDYLTGQVSSNNNIGFIYFHSKNPKLALKVFEESEELLKKISNPYEEIVVNNALALCHRDLKNYTEALAYSKKALEISKENKIKEREMMSSRYVSSIYDSLGNHKEALKYFILYADLMDDLRDSVTQKIVEELKTQYNTEKQEQIIANQKSSNEKQKALNEKQLEINKRQKNQLLLSVISVAIVLIFLILMIRQYLEKRKANNQLQHKNEEVSQQNEEIQSQRDEIYKQKELIEDQQKGILDSIQYASRIQQAVLPQTDILFDIMGPEHFVLFKPRDIVSGDFFWMGKIGNRKIIVAADCTGHGVPGAFMSMLGIAFLNEIVNTGERITANVMLNQLRELVIHSLRQTGKTGEQKDGMDLSLYIINEDESEIEFAGANNPILIVRPLGDESLYDVFENEKINQQILSSDYTKEQFQVITLKADKMPIGIYASNKPFENITFKIRKGDVIYAFSDGYQDQFGGLKNKKFMIKNLKQLLVNNYQKEMSEQERLLDNTIENWKKEGNCDQIDDILVIGMRVC
ncbi:MAG: tetratricopeptide repeat protein [Bacteroidales bacterium]|nr:tetratricopeptide repeat protein [Bacteroidales bacterium]